MADLRARQLWDQIREGLEEKLQYGLLDQAKRVSSVRLEGSELILSTSDDEAFEFFSAQINQQRLVIASRGLFALSAVRIERIAELEPERPAEMVSVDADTDESDLGESDLGESDLGESDLGEEP